MPNYDAAGDVKRQNFFLRTSVVFLIVGAVMLTAGLILIGKGGLDKYVKKYSAEKTFDADEITELDFEIGAADIEIKATDDDKISVEAKDIPYDLNCRTEKGRLYVYGDEKDNVRNIAFAYIGNKKTNPKITILVPKKEYSSIRMEFGLGEADVYDLDCKKLRIETGMSEVVLNSCTASDSAEIECGMSDIDFKDCTFNMCSFDIGMSDLDYSGSITGESSFDGGMCEYDFELDGNRSDYYIKGADVSGSGSNNTDGIRFKCDVGMGDIDFKFR